MIEKGLSSNHPQGSRSQINKNKARFVKTLCETSDCRTLHSCPRRTVYATSSLIYWLFVLVNWNSIHSSDTWHRLIVFSKFSLFSQNDNSSTTGNDWNNKRWEATARHLRPSIPFMVRKIKEEEKKIKEHFSGSFGFRECKYLH